METVELLKALADDTRYKIFTILLQDELCACKILEEFSITQPTLSFHMKKLVSCGLVNHKKDGIWVRYSINHDAVDQLKCLFDIPGPKEQGIVCCGSRIEV